MGNQVVIEKSKSIILGFVGSSAEKIEISFSDGFNALTHLYFRLPVSEETNLKEIRPYLDLIIANLLYFNFNLYSSYSTESENKRAFALFAELRLIELISREYFGIRQNLSVREAEIRINILQEFSVDAVDLLLAEIENEESFYKKLLSLLSESSRINQDNNIEETIDITQKEVVKSSTEQKTEKLVKENQINQVPATHANSRSRDVASQTSLQNFQEVEENPDIEDSDQNLSLNEEYKIYTKAYDEEIRADKLFSTRERQHYWLQLNEFFSEYKIKVRAKNVRLISSLVKHKKYVRKTCFGKINHSMLAAIYRGDNSTKLFVNNKKYKDSDISYTILFDNSGSMHGKPIKHVVDFIYSFARILDRVKIKYEILGFTSRSWKGGRSRLDWEKAGSPKNPGRLNEQRHVIYKDINDNFTSVCKNLALVCKPGFLKENIDGEALEWSYRRSLKHKSKKHYFVYVSDGVPIDDATLNCNLDKDLLKKHLRKMVEFIEGKKNYKLIVTGPHSGDGEIYENFIPFMDYKDIKETLLSKIQNQFRN